MQPRHKNHHDGFLLGEETAIFRLFHNFKKSVNRHQDQRVNRCSCQRDGNVSVKLAGPIIKRPPGGHQGNRS